VGIFDSIFGGRKRDNSDPNEALQKLERHLFPGGQRDVDQMAKAILTALPGKFSHEEAEQLGRGVKVIDYISDDRSEERLLIHLRPKSPNLTEEERLRLIHAVVGDARRPREGNGDGSSRAQPIVITAKNSIEGIDAEYRMLERLLGPQNKSWTLVSRANGRHGASYLEWFVVQPKSGQQRTVYFDITSFYGKR
jgi:hypothetical protein